MSERLLQHPAVLRVQNALREGGSATQVIGLAESARTAGQAAEALGVPVGAIVKSLVFAAGAQPVLALVAGDRRCDTEALGAALGLGAPVTRADADLVRRATGFAIGGVAPVGHPGPMSVALDASLRRFDVVYAAAGHPHCVFATNVDELLRLTGATESPALAIS